MNKNCFIFGLPFDSDFELVIMGITIQISLVLLRSLLRDVHCKHIYGVCFPLRNADQPI